jgi:hypothetical protein
MITEQAITDPENQPSQFGTIPIDDPRFVVSEWRPIAELDRTKDDTYLVRVESASGGPHPGWVDKGYYADDTRTWLDDAGKPLERGPWKITHFAAWPEFRQIEA